MEADGVAAALKHGALEVVVECDPWTAAQRSEGRLVSAQEARHPGAEEEAQEEHPRVREHHHEGHQCVLGQPDTQLAKMAPVDLRLLAWQRS